jgi:hypothetical protein
MGTAMLYHGGALGNITISPQEFTPRDIMELNIYDKNYVLPDECKENDPHLPYCQFAGLYELTPDYYNTVDPYDHMNENCPSRAPEYLRPDFC